MRTFIFHLITRLSADPIKVIFLTGLVASTAATGCLPGPVGRDVDNDLRQQQSVASVTLKDVLLTGASLLRNSEDASSGLGKFHNDIEAITTKLLPVTVFIEATRTLLGTVSDPVGSEYVDAVHWSAIHKLYPKGKATGGLLKSARARDVKPVRKYARERFGSLRAMQEDFQLARAASSNKDRLRALSATTLTPGELETLTHPAAKAAFFRALKKRAVEQEKGLKLKWGLASPELSIDSLHNDYRSLPPGEAAANLLMANTSLAQRDNSYAYYRRLREALKANEAGNPEKSTKSGSDLNNHCLAPHDKLLDIPGIADSLVAAWRQGLSWQLSLGSATLVALGQDEAVARDPYATDMLLATLNTTAGRRLLKAASPLDETPGQDRPTPLSMDDMVARAALAGLFRNRTFSSEEWKSYVVHLKVFLHLACTRQQ